MQMSLGYHWVALFIGKCRPNCIKVTVLPKLQYCRVVSRECCGAGGAAYTSDAVDRHLCSLRVPCERERRTRGPAAPAAPAAGAAPLAPPPPPPPPPTPPPPPPPPPGPFIYNTIHAPALPHPLPSPYADSRTVDTANSGNNVLLGNKLR
ncbi:unnamed protein product, partial [Brenthis ino]